MNKKNKLKLDPNTALTMLWGSKVYKSEASAKFIQHYDLSKGEEFLEKYNNSCNFYSELVINRKFIVMDYIQKSLSFTTGESLIINLGAGKFPLALELLNEWDNKINKILEIDIEGMDEKQALYDNFFPEFSNKIKCLTADINSGALLCILKDLLHEYFNDLPCIIILEGISYNIEEGSLEKIISNFKSSHKNNTLIIEYLLPHKHTSKKSTSLPPKMLEVLKEYNPANGIASFTEQDLKHIVDKNGGGFISCDTMTQIEKRRTGKNKFFKKPEDGLIECSAWQL